MVRKAGLPPLDFGVEVPRGSGGKPAFLTLRLSNSNSKTFLES